MPRIQRGGKAGDSDKAVIPYAALRVMGYGTFGIVFQAKNVQSGEMVAIKKVLLDRRYKCRELDIYQAVQHPCVVGLKHCFYSCEEKSEVVFLNLVMEYLPQTLHEALRNHAKAQSRMDIHAIRIYLWQAVRAIARLHDQEIVHRDIKPQNLLYDPTRHLVKLCDFGSAKKLETGEKSVSYICSRYYRAPELIYGCEDYTCAIDVWSFGCVFGELLMNQPLFPGESKETQYLQIMRLLGQPTEDELQSMNPKHGRIDFPHELKADWESIYDQCDDDDAVDLLRQILVYNPNERPTIWQVLCHPFFDPVRNKRGSKINGRKVRNLYNWTQDELASLEAKQLFGMINPNNIMDDSSSSLQSAFLDNDSSSRRHRRTR